MLLTAIMQDARYALRQLRTAPTFTLTVLLTLALSVGVATAVFCVIDAVMLRPLPYVNPAQIMAVNSQSGTGYNQPSSWPSYCDERAQLKSFQAFAAYFATQTNMTTQAGTVRARTVSVSDNFFDVFSVPPLLGRTFRAGEQEDGRNNLIVLSYDSWKKYFEGQSSIVGQAVRVDGTAYTVIGVMPDGFRFPLSTRDAIYRPLHIDTPWMLPRGMHWLKTIARLRDGVSLNQAQAERTAVLDNLGRLNPTTDDGRRSAIVPLSSTIDKAAKQPLWVLLAAVFAVLAIGCVNIAGLLLARGIKREREMAMRVAIGASRMRLLAQMLTEGMFLAVLGSVGGVLLAALLLHLMRTFLLHALQRGADVHLNWTVLGASLTISVLTSLAASLFPAMRLSRINPNNVLKSGRSAGTRHGQAHLRSGFVIAQVALTLVLLVVAGLLMRVVTSYRHVNLGFDPDHILTLHIAVAQGDYAQRDVLTGFYQPLIEHLNKMPGVRAAGIVSKLPIDSYGMNSSVHITGQPPNGKNQEKLAEVRYVTPGYFDAMGIALHAGRALTPSLDSDANKAGTVVVNQAFVKSFIPNGLNAINQHVDDSDIDEQKTQIVGVTGDVRQNINSDPLAEMDYLVNEVPVAQRVGVLNEMSLVVRADGDPRQIIPALRSVFREIDPSVPFESPELMSEVISDTLAMQRMESWLFGIFAVLALVLALIGLYGLMSNEVAQSSRDISVRMALGATRNSILSMVMRRVAWMLLCGVAAGLVLTFFARKIIAMLIYFEAQKELMNLLVTSSLLVVAGLLAALIPALRAASIDPMEALRGE
jgi:putative ABC transport system permease protein